MSIFVCGALIAVVLCLSEVEGEVAVLDHVLDLATHGEGEEDDEVDEEDWPEDGDVEDAEPGADEAREGGAGGIVPELELWQTADERAKLAVLLGVGRGQGLALLHVLIPHVLLKRRVKLGLQERQKQVQQIDAQRVAHNVPALGQHDA
ncbi:hypothetical protein TRICI_001450 [Trichomonascus ciferrii]|uniref:Secreted protein n=1 Tax=Trichomonascus ciferrii TaxID=44093 RepID=A0A642VAU3_9ASCO|nr:hypothetical protein TRICI_001450 [Trichomonascus ciferrii]